MSEKKKESKNEIIETNQIINIYTNKNTVADKKQKEKEDIKKEKVEKESEKIYENILDKKQIINEEKKK